MKLYSLQKQYVCKITSCPEKYNEPEMYTKSIKFLSAVRRVKINVKWYLEWKSFLANFLSLQIEKGLRNFSLVNDVINNLPE